MTPIEEVQQLKDNFLSSISGLFYHDQTIFSIEFKSEENDLGINPVYLTQDDVLTLADEFGSEIDEKITAMSVEVIAYILTLIQNNKYTVYERI